MYCTRCGNPMTAHTKECHKCGYVLTQDEFMEGIEEEKQSTKKHAKKVKEKPAKVVSTRRQITEANASEVTIIKDTTRDTSTKYVSGSRFLGYLFLVCADFSFLTGVWYLMDLTIILSALFFVVSIVFLLFGIYIVKSAGVDSKFLKEKSFALSIIGLLISLSAFILLIVELGYGNKLLMFVAIGLLIIGASSFVISVTCKGSSSNDRK